MFLCWVGKAFALSFHHSFLVEPCSSVSFFCCFSLQVQYLLKLIPSFSGIIINTRNPNYIPSNLGFERVLHFLFLFFKVSFLFSSFKFRPLLVFVLGVFICSLLLIWLCFVRCFPLPFVRLFCLLINLHVSPFYRPLKYII